MGFALKEVIRLENRVPVHIAMIMDGNGRWAKKRGEERTSGHLQGSENVRTIALACKARGVKYLTLYAFSTENWSRPSKEVEYLCKLPKMFLKKYLKELIENNIKVTYIGDLERFPKDTKSAIEYAVEQTAHLNGMELCLAVNYGGRRELALAARAMASVDTSDLSEEELENVFESYLQSAHLPDADLMIRTSGEERISNYLLWKLAYGEFVFTDVAWPDFDEDELDRCLNEYYERERRFGGLV